jgi:hypothetical protein
MCTGDIFRYSVSAQCFMSLRTPAGSAVSWQIGTLIGRSLNQAFQNMMDNPALQWIWIMGDDHTYAPDTILRLLEHGKDVIAPVCLNRLPPLDPTIVEHIGPGKGRLKPLEDLPTSGLYKLADNETCGDAGLLIRRNVLEALSPEKMGEAWHASRKSGALDAEDQSFIQKIKANGFDVFVDLETTIGHIVNITAEPVIREGKWEIALSAGNRPMINIAPVPHQREPMHIP